MKKFITVLLMVTLCAVTLSGCKTERGSTPAGQEQEEKVAYKFGYSCISMKNPYFIELESKLRTELEQSGHSLMTMDADNDAELQMEQIEQLIKEKVDAVFLIPVDWEEISPALDMLNEAGIKIINLDTRVREVKKIDAYVGSKNSAAGALCGEDLLRRLPEGGEIIIVECPNRNSINDRIKGFERAIAKKGFEVVARIDAKSQVDLAAVEVEKVLKEHPNVKAIMCGSDPMAIGALVAARTVGTDNLIIYGVDGSPEVKEELTKEHSNIVATVAQSTKEMSTAAVNVATLMLDGEKFERNTYIETFLVTKENVQEYAIDEWQ